MKPDKWAIKEKELYKTEKECFNGWEYDEARAKLDQLRECWGWHKEKIEKIKGELKKKRIKVKVDCQDCGNADCQNVDHTFTYAYYIPFCAIDEILSDVDEVFSDAKDD